MSEQSPASEKRRVLGEVLAVHSGEHASKRASRTAVREMAAERGVSTAQLTLAWLLAKDWRIVPIPGIDMRTRV